MKIIFYLFLSFFLFPIIIYCCIETRCLKQHACFTDHFYNYSDRPYVTCDEIGCSEYACIINNVIYKGAGCKDDDQGYCQHNKNATILNSYDYRFLPHFEIIDIDLTIYKNLSNKPCDYEPIDEAYFKTRPRY